MALRLASLGWEVTGFHRGKRAVDASVGAAPIRIATGGFDDRDRLAALLADTNPDYIFHLAGQTSHCASVEEFEASLQSNVVDTCHLLDAVRSQAPGAIVVVPGSSAQFGEAPPDRRLLTEDSPYKPRTLHGVSKTAEAGAADYYHRVHGLRIVRTHTFNCMGPGQRDSFVPAAFARQIAAMEKGRIAPVLAVGNLAARRDVTDIRDVADAYLLAATRGRPGEVYNVCSGHSPSIGELIERLRGMSRVKFDTRQDAGRLQRGDVPAQRGDAGKLRRETDWRPLFALDDTLADVLEEWRAKV